ncbi:MAG: glycosyltransferase [Cyanobacteria bacterium P01_D01_bin.156]
MTTPLNQDKNSTSRILVVSVRDFRYQVANCILYEFEDLICDLEKAKLYTPKQEYDFARKIYRFAKYATGSNTIASAAAPFPSEVVLQQEYDLLFVVCDNPWQLHILETVKNWREKCHHKACYIMETWKLNFDDWRLAYEPFKNFDYIFAGTHHCVETYSDVTGLPAKYLPPAIDALKFCPYPNPPERTIDVCCVGRRHAETHNSIFSHSQREENFFYYYDTVNNRNLEVGKPREHRAKLVNLLQRSRYNIAANARFDALNETGGYQEIGSRYFEAVAAGTILLGMSPAGDVFPQYFDWEDAIIKVDLFEEDALKIIQELDEQPERLESIRRRNVLNALLKHDWVYRWREVLNAFDLAPSPAVIEREKHLQTLAKSIKAMDMPLVH